MTDHTESSKIFGMTKLSGIKTMVFAYLYSVFAICLPFLIIRYITEHRWTEQMFWIPLFDSCLPPASLRQLDGIEYERIIICYSGLAIINAFNRILQFFCDNDGKY